MQYVSTLKAARLPYASFSFCSPLDEVTAAYDTSIGFFGDGLPVNFLGRLLFYLHGFLLVCILRISVAWAGTCNLILFLIRAIVAAKKVSAVMKVLSILLNKFPDLFLLLSLGLEVIFEHLCQLLLLSSQNFFSIFFYFFIGGKNRRILRGCLCKVFLIERLRPHSVGLMLLLILRSPFFAFTKESKLIVIGARAVFRCLVVHVSL